MAPDIAYGLLTLLSEYSIINLLYKTTEEIAMTTQATDIKAIRKEIQEFIDKSSTNAVTMVRKREHLVSAVEHCHGDTLNEQIYNFLHDDVQHYCPEGKAYKFKSLTKGYGYCGPVNGKNQCKCAVAASTENNKKAYYAADKAILDERVRKANETKAKKAQMSIQQEIDLLKSNGVSDEVIAQLMKARGI